MSTLRTGFEQRGHIAPWTTRDEEDTYLDALLAESPNLSQDIVGTSVQGTPMRLFKIGTGPYKIAFICQQHGAELSGREAALTLLREWAHTTNPDMQAYLAQATILIMPTAHPDNLTSRVNSNGVDLNRDHVQLTQPETQSIHTVLRDHTPDVVIDVHEGRNISNHYATGPALNGNIDTDLAQLSVTLEDAVVDAITDAGYTWERYQGSAAMVGAENLHNNAGIRNHLSLLLESRRTGTDNTDAHIRHELQLLAMQRIVDWHHQHLQHVRATVAEARANALHRNDPIQLMTGTLPYSGPIIDPMPTGYLLTESEHNTIELHRNLFDLESIKVSDGWFMPTGQWARTVLAYLLDSDSSLNALPAERDFRQHVIPYEPPIHPPVDLTNIIGYKFNLNGVIYDASLTSGPHV